jgi:hypothetical protein
VPPIMRSNGSTGLRFDTSRWSMNEIESNHEGFVKQRLVR